MRRRIARAVRFTPSDWRLLAGASLIQMLTACALRALSLPTLRMLFARLRPLANFMLKGSDERVIWAIEASGRRLAGVSTCLVRAIIVEMRLSTPDRPLRLTIGVRRAAPGDLHAHAWVDDRSRVLIGASTAEEFLPLVAWDSLPT
jgi:transglutaminase superfamily protein